MIYFNMSLCIVAAFLVFTLIVGMYFSRKKTTFREYAVGNKQFATATLVATVLATNYGGAGLLRNVACVHDHGLWWIVHMFLAAGSYWVVSRLAMRMGPFMQHLSMAETMGHIYGTYPRVIAALFCICKCIVIVTMQITAVTHAINMCLSSVNPFIVTVLTTLLLIFYSTFGGIRSVTFTDVLQFLTFSIVIPLLAWFMFVKLGKPIPAIISILQRQAKFQFSNLFHLNTDLVSMFLFMLSIWASTSPIEIQRVYMASSPIQAQKVFSYALLFNLVISFFIILTGLFVFLGAPDLPKTEIWGYIVAHIPPIFKGFFSIALLAMAMSTADSCLNVCAIMVGHDVVKSLQREKKIPDRTQLKIARWTTLIVGLLAMLLAFKSTDLLKLLHWSLACDLPIVTAPFILAVFGFRGTARTALIGMTIGGLTILTWNKWIEPAIGMDGSFLAMVANGLAMLAAHYLPKQRKDRSWVSPDDQFKQLQQEHARKRAERKERIKNAWSNRKLILAELMPSHAIMVYVGCYIAITSLLAYFIAPIMHHGCWLILQLFGAACCLGYPYLYDIFNKIRSIPNWLISLSWLMGLALYLPLNLLGHWWHLVDPIFSASLSLVHSAVILWLLPLYLGVSVVAATLLTAIYPIAIGLSFPMLCSLLPLFAVSVLLFANIICLKVKLIRYKNKILYLENQEKIRESQQLKASLYDAAAVPPAAVSKAKGYGAILRQVISKIEESISFLDSNMPLYKQDFQNIINKLYDWVAYFNRSAKAKKRALLQPTKITLDKLMRKVELALSQEVSDPPRLLIEKLNAPNGAPSAHIVCDTDQIVYLLTQAVVRVGKQEEACAPVVRIQLHATALEFTQANPIDNNHSVSMLFQATALVVSQAPTRAEALPKVKERYEERIDAMGHQGKQKTPPSIDLQQETIATIASAHYGYYWEAPGNQKPPTMLLVLPNDFTDILSKMTTTLPIDCLTSEAPVTPKEQADSMMALMQFHDYVCKSAHQMIPIDVSTISSLLLLLRQHFGVKRHASGQLFYLRAVGIAKLVAEWAFHAPKIIYAALLYELVGHAYLPLAYVKEHYHVSVYAFVKHVLGLAKRQDLDHPSLMAIQNRLKKAVKADHLALSVLFIQLAERLYDLRHAVGYTHLTEVQHIAQETLTIDVQIANTYLRPEVGTALEEAAKKALELCKNRDKREDTDS